MRNEKFRWLIIFALGLALYVGAQDSTRADVETQPWIRVALGWDVSTASIQATGASRINLLESPDTLASYDSAHTYSFEISGGKVRLSGSSESPAAGFSIICGSETDRLKYDGASFRHIIRVVASNGKITVVNVTPMEQYLCGVVPGEMPSNWPLEALKAQAVAARTYALRCLGQYPLLPFDVYDSTMDQVFGGTESEAASTTLAVQETSGLVCTHNGTPIKAYYHAASGGWTIPGSEVFSGDLPYCRPVPSRDASIYRWTYPISPSTLATKLRARDFDVGTIQRVWVHKFSEDGRAEELKIVHSGGVLIITGKDLRRALGASNIKSSYFTVEGQAAPEIPDMTAYGPSENTQFVCNPADRYCMTNPNVTVPAAIAVPLDHPKVMTVDGVSEVEEVKVLTADGIVDYDLDYVWAVEGTRVRNLDQGWVERFFSLTSSVASGIESEPTVVDDPGGDVGNPEDGQFVFVGHGYGHGVGMSQFGAKSLSETGYTCEQILKYFYTGIEVEKFW